MVSKLFAPLLLATVWCALLGTVYCECNQTVEDEVQTFLKGFNQWVKANLPIYQQAAWNYATNVTDYNSKLMLEAGEVFERDIATEAAKGTKFIKTYKVLCNNVTVKELAHVLAYRNTGETSDEVKAIGKEISQIVADMEGIYSKGKVCIDKSKTCLKLEPGLTKLLDKSRDASRLLKAWKGWRDASGKKMREKYKKFVKLNAELLKLKKSSFKNLGQRWKAVYNVKHPEEFVDDVKDLLEQVKPLYQHIHSFVRRRLETIYSNDPSLFTSPLIPAHLLGNMWAQTWSNLRKDLMPFPDKKAVDITSALGMKNYTVMDMFKTSEDFFKSLGLMPMTPEFWKNTMMNRPHDGRDVVCHASAWDFGDGKDFRIKMCANINQEDFITIHHEMGHIEYDRLYSKLGFVFQNAANPGFHEAVGDTLALSVETIKHLKTIGLLEQSFEDDSETDINYLMAMALDKIVFLPFAYVIDRWRWDVFSGNVTADNYNKHWWDLRCKYQGLKPPVERTEEDFDPGAKYHVAANVPYIRYFVSFVIQFQFYEALCNATNYRGPLYKCDFYNSTKAGDKFREMLELGSSVSWPEALEKLTGSRKMDIGSLMRYFEPLIRYFKSVNGHFLDWEDECAPPTTTMTTLKPMTTTDSASSIWQPFMVAMMMLGTLVTAMVNF